VTRITANGLELLARLDEPLQNTLRDMLGHLGQKRLAELRKLLTACREGLA
jgi:DNA-binding MarR family transcriptional regulator